MSAEWYQAPPELRPSLKNQAQRREPPGLPFLALIFGPGDSKQPKPSTLSAPRRSQTTFKGKAP
jgi:hypothetical protein